VTVTAAIVATGIVTVVAAEIGVRFLEARRTSVPPVMSTLYYQHRRLGHALIRNHAYYDWAHVDQNGFRRIPDAPEDGDLRILVVGGSTTFDTQVPGDAAAWPARLQYWLDRMVPDTRIRVINGGVPGYHVIDNLIRWQTELSRTPPDILIVYHAHNDLYTTLRLARTPPSTSSRPDAAAAVPPWSRWLADHSMLYHALRNRREVRAHRRAAADYLDTPLSAEVWTEVLDEGAATYASDLQALITLAGDNARVIVPEVVHVGGSDQDGRDGDEARARWASQVPYAPPETVLDGYARFARAAESVTASTGARFVPHPAGLTGPGFFADGDPVHFNARGADAYARALAQWLADSLLVDVLD
jgi:lysophospholipase L1-like esterase